jgi:exopolysaccharide biosynthesis WecB/TagA/CpsF family protein
MGSSSVTVTINNCPVTFASYEDRIRMLEQALHDRREGVRIGYANAHTIVMTETDRAFRLALQHLSLVFADGIGVFAAASLLKRGAMKHQRHQNATDFNYRILEHAHAQRLKIFLLGGTAEVADACARRIATEFPNIRVVGAHHGYIDVNDADVAGLINAAAPDVLLIGMGHPIQEVWIRAHASDLRVPVVLAVGAFFDFYSGLQLRAPELLRTLHCEWLFRLIREPKRLWRRYILGIPHFAFIALRGKRP